LVTKSRLPRFIGNQSGGTSYAIRIYWTTLRAGIPNMKHYRNREDLTSTEGEYVEAGSLWSLQDDQLILVDEDRYATALIDGTFAPVTD